MLKTSSIRLLTGGLILLNLLVPLADANAADAAAGQELASLVVRAGGKVVEGPEGVVSIDLFNGNNPTKGQGGPNEAVTDDWLACLEGCSSLRRLSLQNCAITNAGLVHLRRLDLSNAQVNDGCLRKAAALPALEEILIGGPTLTREGLLALAACKSLKKIALGQMKEVSADDIESLRQQRPDIQVIKR